MRSLITKFAIVAFVAIGMMQDGVQGVQLKALAKGHKDSRDLGFKLAEIMLPTAPGNQTI